MVVGDGGGESAELPRLGGVCVCMCVCEREGGSEGLGALINLR